MKVVNNKGVAAVGQPRAEDDHDKQKGLNYVEDHGVMIRMNGEASGVRQVKQEHKRPQHLRDNLEEEVQSK